MRSELAEHFLAILQTKDVYRPFFMTAEQLLLSLPQDMRGDLRLLDGPVAAAPAQVDKALEELIQEGLVEKALMCPDYLRVQLDGSTPLLGVGIKAVYRYRLPGQNV